ncbi:MAG TPA: VOC family protein [Ignavibacteria bacterium]|nr:VOC family protein [Ignavibacteria bacterium]
MTKEMWINLPVKDPVKSRKFYEALGCEVNDQRSNDQMTAVIVGDQRIAVMLFRDDVFNRFINDSTPQQGTEVIFSFSSESPEAVREITERARKAGATIFAEPQDVQGWMYTGGFADLDGHKWNALYMDMSKMPQ